MGYTMTRIRHTVTGQTATTTTSITPRWGGLLTLPVQNMRSRAASVCTKQTVRAVRQVTRPVSQTRYTAGLRGHLNLPTGRQAAR